MAAIDNSLLPSIADDAGNSGDGLDYSRYSALFGQAAGGLTSAYGSHTQAQGQRWGSAGILTGARLQALGLKDQLLGQKSNLIGQRYQLAGQKMQLAGQQASLDYQAHIAALNATLAELASKDAFEQGTRQVQQARLATGQMLGTQRASMAARGIDLASATPVNLQATTRYMGEVDANTLELNAMRQAFGLRMQAVGHRNESLMDTASAQGVGLMDNAIDPNVINPDAINPDAVDTTWMNKIKLKPGADPGLAMAGSLLSSVGSVASRWYGASGKF